MDLEDLGIIHRDISDGNLLLNPDSEDGGPYGLILDMDMMTFTEPETLGTTELSTGTNDTDSDLMELARGGQRTESKGKTTPGPIKTPITVSIYLSN